MKIGNDGWQVSRDEQVSIAIDAMKFPNGMKALAHYVPIVFSLRE